MRKRTIYNTQLFMITQQTELNNKCSHNPEGIKKTNIFRKTGERKSETSKLVVTWRKNLTFRRKFTFCIVIPQQPNSHNDFKCIRLLGLQWCFTWKLYIVALWITVNCIAPQIMVNFMLCMLCSHISTKADRLYENRRKVIRILTLHLFSTCENGEIIVQILFITFYT